MPDDKFYDEGSLADLAAKGLIKISRLSQSQRISDKLKSLDMMLFVFIITFVVSHFLSNTLLNPNQFVLLVILGVSFIFGLIANIFYAHILEAICNLVSNKIRSLRFGIILMFISLSLAILGFLFKITLVCNLALGVLGLHLIIIPVGILLPTKEIVADKEIKPSQIWGALGKIGSIAAIISLVIDIILFLNFLIF